MFTLGPPCVENFEKTLEIPSDRTYLPLAQFRTCLWPRAGRWASGQEAGQPPGTRVRSRGMDIPEARTPDRKGPRPEQRPAAGGETGEPRSPRGTQLKATTERAFLVSAGFQIRRLKRLVHLARRAVGVSPSKQWQLLGRRARPAPSVSPSHGRRDDSSPLSPGGLPPAT